MHKAFCITLTTLSLATAQTSIGIHSVLPGSAVTEAPKKLSAEAARPLLGYIADSSNTLRSVVGSINSPQWGDPVTLPESASAFFLPPRQEYVLLSSRAELGIARLSRSTIYPSVPIPHAMPTPDRVVFSPSGETAALLSRSQSRLEVFIYLAGKAQVVRSLPVSNPDELQQLAISDDGELIVALWANQTPVSSWKGSSWQSLSTDYYPHAWMFLPRSHDLVVSDRTQKAIVVLHEAGKSPILERVLAAGTIDANLLMSNKSGSQLIAASGGTTSCWSINLASGNVTLLPERKKVESLTLLRDGETFITSTKGSPLIDRLIDDATQAISTAGSH